MRRWQYDKSEMYPQKRKNGFGRKRTSGFGRVSDFEIRDTYENNRVQMENEALREEIRRLKKEAEEKKLQEEIDAKAQNQRFCPFDDSDDDSDGGGAPIMRQSASSNRSNKKRSRDNTPPPAKKPKVEKKEEIEQRYKCLESLNVFYPETITDLEKEEVEYTDIRCPLFKESPRRRERHYSPTYDLIESEFPGKPPTVDPSDPDVFFLEGAPYDRRNDASVDPGSEELDWSNMTYEEFKAKQIVERNAFNLSSAKVKHNVYIDRINKAMNVRERVECYVEMIKLEDALTEELKKTGELGGRVNVDERKLGMVQTALQTCGQHIELRLLEIDILTSMHGENSPTVKNAWDQLMTKFPNDLKMWRHRLTYFRNKRSLFNAQTYIKENIFACLSKLGGIINGTFKSHPKQQGTEEFITDVIVAAATLYIELGAMHKAIGIVQALVEFFILTPTNVEKFFDFKRKLETFELFWKTAIPKAGEDDALGWNKVDSNPTFNKYDYPKNSIRSAKDETEAITLFLGDVFLENCNFCVKYNYESDYYMWQAVEKDRTEKIWKPSYNEATSSLYNTYNSFDSIKPFLIQLPKKIVEDAIYGVLTKLGAVIPTVKNNSHEAIHETYFSEDTNFKMIYAGMDKFIDNILLLLSGANKDYYLFATIARLTTAQSFTLKSKKTFIEAKNQFMKLFKEVYLSVERIRELTTQERLFINSYVFQMIDQMRLTYKEDEQVVDATDPKYFQACIDVFTPQTQPTLLSALRHFVMICRTLPYFEGDQSKMSKLQFLVKITSLDEEVNALSKKDQQKAMKKWKEANFHEKIFALLPGTRWMGDINTYALELVSTLAYEAQENPALKFNAFKEYIPEHKLWLNEDLAEFYFQVWQRHVRRYNEEKKDFMMKLDEYVRKYPRNDVLTMMYINNLQRDEMDLRVWFLMNKAEDDDVAKGIRSVAQVGTEIAAMLSGKNVIRRNFAFTAETITRAAEMNLTSIIPESYLWRLLLQYINTNKEEDVKNTFIVVNDRCAWSKILSLFAASLKNTLAEEIEELAKKAGIEMKISLPEVKELYKKH